MESGTSVSGLDLNDGADSGGFDAELAGNFAEVGGGEGAGVGLIKLNLYKINYTL